MRNPNGFGCVYRATGNRRRPYIARITVGWDEMTGKQIFKQISSHTTYSEAMKALADYNADPYDLNASKITFGDVYQKWSEKKFLNICKSNVYAYQLAFRELAEIHNIPFHTLRTYHFQKLVDESGKNYRGRERLKMLLTQMCNFALNSDIVNKNYANYISLGERSEPKIIRLPFVQSEIETLFNSVHQYHYVDTILMMIFSGIRPGELLTIETDNVFLDENYFICGIKNLSSKNRKVPISGLVKPFFEKNYYKAKNVNSKWLIMNSRCEQMTYSNYNRDKFIKIMKIMKMNHMPHDCRHSFATYMDKANASKLSIQNIMGHAPRILVDKVYTHKQVEELREEISKLETIFNPNIYLSLINKSYFDNSF